MGAPVTIVHKASGFEAKGVEVGIHGSSSSSGGGGGGGGGSSSSNSSSAHEACCCSVPTPNPNMSP